MNIWRGAERGQALVLIILAFIGMVGLSALAIDGGMIYAERRRAQNAADAAVYAGALHMAQSGYHYASNQAGWNSAYTVAITKAISQASTNGFTSSANTTVTFVSPPDPALADFPSQYAGDRTYYLMVIESEAAPVFSQFIYNGSLRYKAWAIARGYAAAPLVGGAAIFATSIDPNRCAPLNFSGGGSTTIEGGNIISNNPNDPADPNIGRNNCHSALIGGSGTINIPSPYNIQTVGSWGGCGSACTINVGNPGTADDTIRIPPLVIQDLPAPDCSEAAMGPMKTIPNRHSDPYVMTPGRWSGVNWTTGDGDLLMEPGMYCIYNGFRVGGGTVTSVPANGQPEGVFFVIMTGDFSTNGAALATLNRPSDLGSNGFQWGGYLLYMPANNLNQVIFGGGGTSTYSGTVYAPGPTAQNSQDKCDVDGSAGNIGMNSQLICNSVNITGTGTVEITYDPAANGQVPPFIELMN